MNMNCTAASTRLLFALILAGLVSTSAQALDLEPRRWSHLPVDTHFFGAGYARTDADIFLDPTLQLEDVEMELDSWVVKYIYSFESFGKSSRIDITQAYQEGRWTGLLQGLPAQTQRQGPSDTFVRYAINLYGAPPLQGKNFVRYRKLQEQETIVGAGLALRLPTGDYQENRLINLGQNRYTIRPQLGVQHNRGRWNFEANAELALFTDNDDFFAGNRLEQDPLWIFYATAAYTFRPGFWIGAGIGYDDGGDTRINGVDKHNRQQNHGVGFNLAYPLSSRLGITATYIATQTDQDTGLDSDSLIASLAWQW